MEQNGERALLSVHLAFPKQIEDGSKAEIKFFLASEQPPMSAKRTITELAAMNSVDAIHFDRKPHFFQFPQPITAVGRWQFPPVVKVKHIDTDQIEPSCILI